MVDKEFHQAPCSVVLFYTQIAYTKILGSRGYAAPNPVGEAHDATDLPSADAPSDPLSFWERETPFLDPTLTSTLAPSALASTPLTD
jgi:hypothetical protein